MWLIGITMKVLTMQLNSVTLMDLMAYGGAGLGIFNNMIVCQNIDFTILFIDDHTTTYTCTFPEQ